MEKQRQMKLLSIVTLVVAIIGMTLGFAAFSTTLSISSSATVTPTSEDFKISLYNVLKLKTKVNPSCSTITWSGLFVIFIIRFR